MLRLVLTLVGVGLTVYAAIDCLRTPPAEVRALPKGVWFVLILLLPVAGPLAWILAGREGPSGGAGGKAAPPVLAPDDDPDFLFQLELERRRREREERIARGEVEEARPDDDGPERTAS